MKIVRCAFLVLFVFLPALVFSQVLTPEDIDIFGRGYKSLYDYSDDPLSEEYNELGEVVAEGFMALFMGEIGEQDFADYTVQFKKFLTARAPEYIESAVKDMGWESGGHEKLWTIMFSLMYVKASEEMMDYDEYKENAKKLEKRISSLIHKDDIALVKSRIDELITMLE